MKNLLLIVFVFVSAIASAQESYHVNLSGSYNSVKSQSIGSLYVSISTKKPVNDYLKAQASLFYLNQKSETSINSFGGDFSFNYYPNKTGFNLVGGFQIGLTPHKSEKGYLSSVLGFGYDINRFEITARYLHSNYDFNNTTLIGIGYKLNGK